MILENRKATIRKEQNIGKVSFIYVVDLYENGRLLETRQLPGKSKSYAEDVEENWLSGVIKSSGSDNDLKFTNAGEYMSEPQVKHKKIVREEVKDRHTSHWDLDLMGRAELEAYMSQEKNDESNQTD